MARIRKINPIKEGHENQEFVDPDFRGRGFLTKEETEEEKERFPLQNPYEREGADMDSLFYNNEEVINGIRKYYIDRKGKPNSKNTKDLVNEFVRDMRWMESNEVSAATTLFYLKNSEDDEVNNFRNIYDTFKAMPNFYQQGTKDETTWQRTYRAGEGVFDYLAATVASPSGVLSLFTGGAGTAAKMAASRAFITSQLQKAGRKEMFGQVVKRGMAEGAAKAALVDMTGGVALNTATQKIRQEIGAQEDFSFGQLGAVSALSAVPGGLMGAYTGRKSVKTARKGADIIQEGAEVRGLGMAALRSYSGSAGKVLNQKETDELAKKITKEFDEFQDELGNPLKGKKYKDKDLDPLDEKTVEKGRKILDETAEELGMSPTELGKFSLSPEVMKRVAGAARVLLKEGGVKYNPKERATKQVYDMLAQEKLPFEVYRDVIEEFGISVNDFAKIYLAQGSEYGRGLGALRLIKENYLSDITMYAQTIQKAHKRTEYELALDAVRNISKKTGRIEQGTWSRLNNMRKGLLVSQPATAIRNAASVGAFQVAPDLLVTGFERMYASLSGQGFKGNPLKDMTTLGSYVTDIATGSKKGNLYIAQLLNDLPKEEKRLFGHLFGDIATDTVGGGKTMRTLEDGVKILNFLNRGQEYLFRSAAFLTHIDRQLLRKYDTNLDELARKGGLFVTKDKNIITQEMITDATDYALELTFANLPRTDTLLGRAANTFINVVNNSPASLAIPFPRFMLSALRYQYQFSPAGLIGSTNRARKQVKAQRENLKNIQAAGKKPTKEELVQGAKVVDETTIRDIGKGLTGTMLFTMGIAMKAQDEHKDLEWYELGVEGIPGVKRTNISGTDKVIDTRALFPIPQYLWAGDTINRMLTSRMKDIPMVIQDAKQALTGTNFRPGQIGGRLVEDFFLLFEDSADKTTENGLGYFADILGSVGAQYLQPFNAINDVLMQYDVMSPVSKDFLGTGQKGDAFSASKISSPTAARILGRLPAGIGDVLYEHLYEEERKYSIDPTLPVNERVMKYDPMLKQLFGLTLGKTSMVDRAFNYYGLNFRDYKFVGGDAEAQRQLNYYLKEITNVFMPAQLSHPDSYLNKELTKQSYTRRERNIIAKDILRKELQGYREEARKRLKAENPNLYNLYKSPRDLSRLERKRYNIERGAQGLLGFSEVQKEMAIAADRSVGPDVGEEKIKLLEPEPSLRSQGNFDFGRSIYKSKRKRRGQ